MATRVLDAGGRIVGKAHCEYFCFSGSSHTNAAGPVRNPRNPAHSSGGSSSGAAALVGAGEADMAIGTDQGGSVRIPAAYSGIYGMKPTHGLIPYTGIMPIEMTLDHAGIMTANVADNALLLDAIAGSDGLDPRQQGLPAARSAIAMPSADSWPACASASSRRASAGTTASPRSMTRCDKPRRGWPRWAPRSSNCPFRCIARVTPSGRRLRSRVPPSR